MKLLYITAHPFAEENSSSRRLSRAFIESYKESHPEDEIKEIDLYNSGINFLSAEDLGAIFTGQENKVKEVAEEFANADKYVFASPMWNLNMPAILKAYIDYVLYAGITFKYTENGPVGLLENKKAVYVLSTGGVYSNAEAQAYNMGKTYLEGILGFYGVTDVKTYMLEGTHMVAPEQAKVNEEELKAELVQAAVKF